MNITNCADLVGDNVVNARSMQLSIQNCLPTTSIGPAFNLAGVDDVGFTPASCPLVLMVHLARRKAFTSMQMSKLTHSLHKCCGMHI